MTSPEFDIDNAPDTVIGGQALDALEYFPDGMFQAIFISQFDFIATDLKEARRLLHKTGTLYLQSGPQGWAEESFGPSLEASTQLGDWVLDCRAHHGGLGIAAYEMGRRFVLIEQDSESQKVIRIRLKDIKVFAVDYHTRLNRSRVRASTRPEPNAPQK